MALCIYLHIYVYIYKHLFLIIYICMFVCICDYVYNMDPLNALCALALANDLLSRSQRSWRTLEITGTQILWRTITGSSQGPRRHWWYIHICTSDCLRWSRHRALGKVGSGNLPIFWNLHWGGRKLVRETSLGRTETCQGKLAPIGFKLAPSWPRLVPCWPQVGPSWPKLAPCWPKLAQVGPKLGQVGPKLVPSWPKLAQVGPSSSKLAQVGPKSKDDLNSQALENLQTTSSRVHIRHWNTTLSCLLGTVADIYLDIERDAHVYAHIHTHV